jgi:hypothetical protein
MVRKRLSVYWPAERAFGALSDATRPKARLYQVRVNVCTLYAAAQATRVLQRRQRINAALTEIAPRRFCKVS